MTPFRGPAPGWRTAGPAGRAGPAHQADPRAVERGSVTVEAAIALSSLVVVLTLCLAGIGAVIAQLRITDAAGEAARLAARGDESGARAAVSELAPSGAELTLSGSGTVTARVVAAPVGGLLPGLRLDAVAVAGREP